MNTVEFAAILLIGFSLGASVLLLLALFTVYRAVEQNVVSRLGGIVLLVGLVSLQLLHADYLWHGGELFDSKIYAALLLLVAPAFYLFFRGALQPPDAARPAQLLYFSSILIIAVTPNALAIPLAFLLGTTYSVRLLLLVYRLRAQRKRFQLELFAFAAFGCVALSILVLGLAAPLVGVRAFVLSYATLIGIAFWLSIYALLRFPDLASLASDVVRTTYAASTLKNIDCADAVARLDGLMENDKVYTDENLSLSRLAQRLELSSHQLSELINTRFGVGFSRDVRERRVAAAKHMLIAEPDASVLSVGLSVGFTSQSNFYAAFREISGEVPGQFRKKQVAPEPD